MYRGRCHTRARAGSYFFAGVLLSIASPSWAKDGHWVTKEGRKIELIRSQTELAVKLRKCDAMDVCSHRLDASGLGKLDHFKRAPLAPYKMLAGTRSDMGTRSRLRKDPDVEDVQWVYRFKGVDSPVAGTGYVVVKLLSGMTHDDVRKLWADYGIVDASAVKGQLGVFRAGVPDGQEELDTAERLADDPRTQWAQPDLRRECIQHQTAPSDQYFDQQWHLNNTGQLGGTSSADIDALEAWTISTGRGVLFGMFDDAVDVDHEDLRDNYIGVGQDIVLVETANGHDDPRPKDLDNRHGTAVMGLAVARANNRGGRGVAYDAQFTASRGLGELATDTQVASAYIFARDQNVDIHINSWGYSGDFPDPDVIADAIGVARATGRNKGDLDGDGVDDPLGMVIVFASGNDDREQFPGLALNALPHVISVGASNDIDVRSDYSNFGVNLSVVAPSNDGVNNAGLFTTDNLDSNEVDKGYNEAGLSEVFEGFGFIFVQEELDQAGSYTQHFGGTSGACPIAAGVAGLILSVNPELTATDVRMLLEHTADKIQTNAADYDSVTGHSTHYGHGRINAGGAGEKLGAVEAAQQSLTNGGHTWPDRPANLSVDDTTVRWIQNPETTEFLVVQSNDTFDFIPQDGDCYDTDQENCTAEIKSLPAGVTALAVGCGLSCSGGAGLCETGAEQCVALPQGKHLAVYARNALGRYSFGVEFDSAGNINGSGTFIDLAAAGDVVIPTGPPESRPEVSISVSPLEGTSPLTVSFRGNALSSIPIDESRTTWDFDTQNPPDVDATSRNVSHVYEVADDETRTIIARLTMYDEEGTPGSAEVAITVHGAQEDGAGGSQSGDLQIIVGLPNTPDSNVSVGTSPFSVVLSVDATELPGTLQAISWDLGDGTTASSLVVPHTYINESTVDLRIPITATVTTSTSTSTTMNTSATRIITVQPGSGSVDDGEVDPCELPGSCASGEGGQARPCGALGLIPLTLMFTLTWIRRRFQ